MNRWDRRTRHTTILKDLIDEAGEDGIPTGELYEVYEQTVEDGHDLVLHGEGAYCRRVVVDLLVKTDHGTNVVSILQSRGYSGRSYRFWLRKHYPDTDKLDEFQGG